MEISEKYLGINKYSRPGIKRSRIDGIALHWVGNPGTTALANQFFFNWIAPAEQRFCGAHEIIGLRGEILLLVPKYEMTYHVGANTYMPGIVERFGKYPNRTLYGVEFCHPDWDGKPNDLTYASIINRLAHLLDEFRHEDTATHLVTHTQVTGKHDPYTCPRYFVENPEAWQQLILDVSALRTA